MNEILLFAPLLGVAAIVAAIFVFRRISPLVHVDGGGNSSHEVARIIAEGIVAAVKQDRSSIEQELANLVHDREDLIREQRRFSTAIGNLEARLELVESQFSRASTLMGPAPYPEPAPFGQQRTALTPGHGRRQRV